MDDVSFSGMAAREVDPGGHRWGDDPGIREGSALYMSWPSGDEVCLRLAMVQLHQCGLGTEEELAEAFGRHVNSVQRYLAGFADEGVRGLLSERSGPKGRWKITTAVRARILLIVLREGVWELEAIQRRLAQDWHEVVSVPSIQQVLEENGLGQAQTGGERWRSGPKRAFWLQEDPPQLCLDLGGQADTPTAGCRELPAQEKEEGMDSGRGAASQVGDPAVGGAARRSYSSAQRVYLDQLEQGAYNTYAGGLLFAPLLARYDFLPTLRR